MSQMNPDPRRRLQRLAVRRERGVKDAAHSHPASSSDPQYMEGYRLGERLRPTLRSPMAEADAKGSATASVPSLQEMVQAERDSSVLALYIALHEANLAPDTREFGGATAALKMRLSRIRKLVLAGDLEGLMAITAPTEFEARLVEETIREG